MLFPQNNKDLDNYPTVTIKGKGDKEDTISEEDCMKRFKFHFYWFHAKSVARYVNHNLVQDFMHPFNSPNYHCFRAESTSIAGDLMDGRTSFGHHSEIALNPLLSGKEGSILHQQITADLRKSVVLRIEAHLHQKVKQEGVHLELREAVQERIIHDQIKFAQSSWRRFLKHAWHLSFYFAIDAHDPRLDTNSLPPSSLLLFPLSAFL